MKKTRLFYSLLMFLMMTTMAWGLSNVTGKWHGSQTALILDTDTRIDVNNLEMFVYNDGNFAYDNANVLGKTDGLYFPRGTKKTVIYSAGLWIGAKVNNETRLSIAEYSSEYGPGPMKDGTYLPDNARFRVYQINKGDTHASNADYANWPVADGAPVDAEGNPKIFGDQMAWSVFNDADPTGHINDAASTAPLGLEVQMSAFGYARGGALGNTVFFKYIIINKGGNTLDSTFISLWADPDLGDASDDLVGCDTLLSLGYCYNEGDDTDYGAAPPAVGFDFFEGPIVPSVGDSALVNGVWRQGFKNLPMASFNKYINGTDPASKVETYGYMKGLTKDPISGNMIPAINPSTEEVTTYSVSGDPVTQTGWVDEAAADRRYMMSAGPFTMAPGDTQEVVAAVIVAQGANPLNSITALKSADVAAQAVFDLNFDIPSPPPSPSVFLRGTDGAVDMTWGTEPLGFVDSNVVLNQKFPFEGFNLYQGESATGPWHKFATFDLADDEYGAALIYGDVVDAAAGGSQRIIIQKGSNSGLTFHQTVTNSQITGVSLKNNQPYYFAVTAYSYDVLNVSEFNDPGGNFLGYITESLESPIVPYEVKPFTFAGVFADTAIHVGNSDGNVVIEYLFPDQITGHDYEVTFNEDDTWNLIDKTLNQTVLADQDNQRPGYQFPVVDGFMIRVMGPSRGAKSVAEVHNATGPVSPPDNVNYSRNSTSEWFMDPLGDHSLGRYSWSYPSLDDYEIRFVEGATENCFDWFGPAGDQDYGVVNPFKVPVELWNIGSGTPDDEIRRPPRSFMLLDDGTTVGEFDWGDGIYFHEIPYGDVNWNDPNDNAGNYDPETLLWSYRRCRFFPLDAENPVGSYPAAGTVVRITTNKANTSDDRFTFKSQLPNEGNGTFIAYNLDNIKTVPNPYYAYYPEEIDQFDRIVKFINLPPQTKMTIKIYNIAGDLLRTLERDGASVDPEFSWDLKTASGLWVASGIYIWVIEADGLGTKFGKMAIFPEVEQLNTF